MGTLYLIRHGQASLGAADYDNLSPLGLRQAHRLGQYFAAKGIVPTTVLIGNLRRHAQTWSAIADGLTARPLPTPWVEPGLNEYDSEALIRCVSPQDHPPPATPDSVRAHFRRLRTGLQQWAQGTLTPDGMPAYREFAQGVADVLQKVRAQCTGDVFAVSSGGPIATAVALTMEAPAAAFIELNMRLRNTAISELHFTPKRHALQTFNTLPHLDAAEFSDWVSYA